MKVDLTKAQPLDWFDWRATTVQGRPAGYGVAGQGRPLVFLHGWGLGYRSYKRSMRQLVRLGFEVYAPGLPGLSGTPDLPAEGFSLGGYAAWVADFLDAVGVTGPALLVGHSFGGGVAIQLAYDFPDRVAQLVVVNSIGGSAAGSGSAVRTLVQRPIWDWGLHLHADLWPWRQVTRVLPIIVDDIVPNLLHNPGGVVRVAGLARRANLTYELEELRRRELPVVVLWGSQDKVLPRLALDPLCAALGTSCVTVPGSHGWLLADPKTFGEVMTNVVALAGFAAPKVERLAG